MKQDIKNQNEPAHKPKNRSQNTKQGATGSENKKTVRRDGNLALCQCFLNENRGNARIASRRPLISVVSGVNSQTMIAKPEPIAYTGRLRAERVCIGPKLASGCNGLARVPQRKCLGDW